MANDTLVDGLKLFIEEKFSISIQDSKENLLISGIIDSMGALELVTEVEDHYTVKFSFADYSQDDFFILDVIAKRIESLKNQP
jgi:acyl carrier protein